MTIDATGHVVRTDSGYDLVIERTYRAPIADVWASIAESARLDRWIGRYDGTPRVGESITFWMTAEGDGPSEEIHVHECAPPTRLLVESRQGEDSWLIGATLSEANGLTTLVFTQRLTDPSSAEDTGPGWEYYLDRLGAVLDNTAFVAWDAYYPAQQDYWRREVATATADPDPA